MKCFNCNEKATTKLSVEPDFGEIYTCSSEVCKNKARSDIERFSNQKDRQGKRKDQVEFAEKIVAYTLLGIIAVTIIVTLASIINRI